MKAWMIKNPSGGLLPWTVSTDKDGPWRTLINGHEVWAVDQKEIASKETDGYRQVAVEITEAD